MTNDTETWDRLDVTDALGRRVGEVRHDGHAAVAEGYGPRQLATAFVDVTLEGLGRAFVVGQGDGLVLRLGPHRIASLRDGGVVLAGGRPRSDDCAEFWHEVSRLLARAFARPPREML